MRQSTHIFFGACLIGALALSGCSNDGKKGSDASEDSMGPLYDYFTTLYGNQEWNQEEYDAQQLKIQELIAECMVKEGFEYTPDTNNGGVVIDSEGDGPEWGSLEFAEQYGYGMMSWPGQDQINEQQEEYVDPNADYVNSLSESEQNAYYETLYGPGVPEEEMEMNEDGSYSYEYDWTKAGCQGQADNEVNGEQSGEDAWNDPEFEDLFTAMNDVYTDTENSPEAAALNKEWSECMADAGYPDIPSRDEASVLLSQEQNQLYSQGEGEEWVEPDPALVDEFQKKEIAQAVADWKCADSIDYQTRYQKIDFEIQQKFVDEHKDQLEALVAKYGKK